MRFIYFIVSSSLLIGLVLWIRCMFRRKLAPGVIYALWLIPLVRLAIPFAGWELPVFGIAADMLNTPYAVISEMLSENTVSEKYISNANENNQAVQRLETEGQTETKVYDVVTPKTEAAASTEPESKTGISKSKVVPHIPAYEWLFISVWAAGSLLIAGYVIVQNRRLRRSVASMKTVAEVEGVKVCVGAGVKVPCLAGMKKPKILVTEEILQDSRLYNCVLQHELAHYHQKDHIWNAVKILMCVIYWWNPFVWFASRCMEEDAELACDARVLRNQTTEGRKAYGYALLQMLENAQGKNHHFYIATSMSGNRTSMKRRIKEITANTVTKQRVLLPTILLMVIVLVLGCGVPSDKSWIKTAEWTLGDNGDTTYSEAEYSYVLQEDIQSFLFFYEVYEYGELTTRQLLSYGEIENAKETMKLRRESSKTTDEEKLIVEFDGIGIEMPVAQPQYQENQDYASSGGALNSDSDKIEIIPETDYILLADFRAEAGEKIQTYDCLELSFYAEKGLQETLKENHFTTFVRCVFSQKSVQELYQSYQQKEYSANDKTADEQWAAKILKINDILYYGTDETGPMGDSGCVEGHIQSSVDQNEIPLNNAESNFGCIGNPYTWDDGDGWIMVFMDDEEYHIFYRKEED